MFKSRTRIKQLFTRKEPFILESGQSLGEVQLAYETYGKLNKDGRNAILVCHALTADAHAAGLPVLDSRILEEIPLYRSKNPDQPGWWNDLIGPGKALDTDRYFIISSNVLGSCYGSTGPASFKPGSRQTYGPDFPEITVRDMVRAQKRLLDSLGVKELFTAVGGSLGGMQVLEWALLYPQMIRSIIPIATSAGHSAWAIGYSHLTRQAIMTDPSWNNGYYRKQPHRGLSLARQIGMVSYRTDISFEQRFGRHKQAGAATAPFKVESYLSYQGKKLVQRFDANSLITLTRAMDNHDVGRGRKGISNALATINARALCIGISSDILYPASEQKQIARAIPHSLYRELISNDGHDSFLIETDRIGRLISDFLNSIFPNSRQESLVYDNYEIRR